jgi:8-oxo-dGTP diphosphatase
LIQERKPSAFGLWNLPAGRVDVGESLEEAAIREAKEESGYTVKLTEQVALFHENAQAGVKHIYKGEIIGGDLKIPDDEIMDAKWYTFEEIESMKDKLRNPWILEAIKKYRKQI